MIKITHRPAHHLPARHVPGDMAADALPRQRRPVGTQLLGRRCRSASSSRCCSAVPRHPPSSCVSRREPPVHGDTDSPPITPRNTSTHERRAPCSQRFGTGQVLWSFLWFFIFIIWIYLLIFIFSDIFRSEDLSRLGQGALVDLHHRRAVPRHLRLPHRPRRQDGRTSGTRRRRTASGDGLLHPNTASGSVRRRTVGQVGRPAHVRQARRRRVRGGQGQGAPGLITARPRAETRTTAGDSPRRSFCFRTFCAERRRSSVDARQGCSAVRRRRTSPWPRRTPSTTTCRDARGAPGCASARHRRRPARAA